MQLRTVSLTTLRTRIRQAAKQENSTFFSDTEINGLVNKALDLYRDTLTESAGVDWLLSSQTFTGVTSSITIPAFSEPVTVMRVDASAQQLIAPLQEEERAYYEANATTISVFMEFIPTGAELAGSDTIDILSAGEEMVVNWVASKMVAAEEGDSTKLEMLWTTELQRLKHQAPRRRTQKRTFVDDRVHIRRRGLGIGTTLSSRSSNLAYRSEGPTTVKIYSLRGV